MDRHLLQKPQKTYGIDEKEVENLRYFVRFEVVENGKSLTKETLQFFLND